VKRLRYLAEMVSSRRDIDRAAVEAADRIEALEAEAARLREALAFYAQPMAYQPTGWMGDRDPSPADQDRGKRARAALTPPAPSPEPNRITDRERAEMLQRQIDRLEPYDREAWGLPPRPDQSP